MTGFQLKELRKSRGLTREQLAIELGDCKGSTVYNWENGISPVPQWVVEKIMSNVKLELPLTDLQALFQLALERRIDFVTILSQAIREYLRARLPKIEPVESSQQRKGSAGRPSTDEINGIPNRSASEKSSSSSRSEPK